MTWHGMAPALPSWWMESAAAATLIYWPQQKRMGSGNGQQTSSRCGMHQGAPHPTQHHRDSSLANDD